MTRFSAKYKATLSSARWRQVRSVAFTRSGGRCERCGKRARLDAHHWLGYRMLGKEKPSDLKMLCRPCHRWAHGRSTRQPRVTLRMVVALALVVAAWWLFLPHTVA